MLRPMAYTLYDRVKAKDSEPGLAERFWGRLGMVQYALPGPGADQPLTRYVVQFEPA